MKKLLFAAMLLLGAMGGCINQDECDRRSRIVEKLLIERCYEAINPYITSAHVRMGNVQFYTDWLIDLKKKGYPITNEDIEVIKCK
jgi:hypothetical protein